MVFFFVTLTLPLTRVPPSPFKGEGLDGTRVGAPSPLEGRKGTVAGGRVSSLSGRGEGV